MKIRILFLGFFISLILGCASQKNVKMYEGELPSNQPPALVKPVAAIQIIGVDGKKATFSPNRGLSTEYELEFAPGSHVFEVSFDTGTFKSIESFRLPIILGSGRKYVIRPYTSGRNWRAGIIDVTDKPQCWTITVGTSLYGIPMGPKDCGE